MLAPVKARAPSLLPLADLVEEEIDAALQELLLHLEAPEDGVSAIEPAEETEQDARLPAHAPIETQDVLSEEIIVEQPARVLAQTPPDGTCDYSRKARLTR